VASPKRKKTKRKKLSPEVLEKRRFVRSIRTMFTNMGFTHVPTEGKEDKFGKKVGELDSVFIYQNVILIVEDTTAAKAFDHAKNKSLLAKQILAEKRQFINWLRTTFPDHASLLDAYSVNRFHVFYLYISKNEMDLDDDEIALLAPMTVVTTRALAYFIKLSKAIRRSARTDLWRYLDLSSGDIGTVNAGSDVKKIETTIIAPDDSTGFNNDVRLVSFMISADVLLRNSYVLRKDNWEYTTDLYQRLVEPARIKKIRKYVATDGSAFLNNIILGLPPTVSFQTADGDPISLDDVQDYSAYRMIIPDEFNSLCLIEGQHRVFAHYEGDDVLESKVAAIRGKIHLLATGLVFPETMNEHDRLQLQSEIFLDVNSNTKPVPADVLLAIQSMREPYADVAIARRVLEELNRRAAFKGMLQLSQMDQAPIKVASIVKFALRYLVDIDSDDGLFVVWAKDEPSRLALADGKDPELLGAYVGYCAGVVDRYFQALKKHRGTEWGHPESRVTSTTVINAMIIALRRSLPALGVLSFQQYAELMAEWQVDFSKERFQFASSQYARFSQQVLRDVFNLVEKDGQWVREG
jgi:DGQHR domain-containing protein